ncbi:MAG: cyclic pyranopterin monophosphate synthase MoaC [Deltaproteobacteria bacterium]|nr:cyclic pyranopterin monophosphate synthase MoaC [Deltaproteobacteria bacterium]
MVDVSAKDDTAREAVARGTIQMTPGGYDLVKAGGMAKGDVLGVARIAGIMAAKKVDQLIPLTHPLNISKAEIAFDFDDASHAIIITATTKMVGKTGVEMEALTAVSVAALTIYDMSKAVDKGMIISDIMLLKKSGGKSGTFIR